MTIPMPEKTLHVDSLPVAIYGSNQALGEAAAQEARRVIQAAIAERGNANIILATGNSQLTFLHALRALDGIDWAHVTVFHMDEYVGIDPQHPASFPRFLRQHILDQVRPGIFYPVPGQVEDLDQACREYAALLAAHPADLVAMGWGENGHIAFNDPPYADFDDPVWVKVVELAEASRRQQVGEGHFKTLAEVPTHAITLTIPALLAPKRILCIVPEGRKAEAVRACLTLPISEDRPGSILRTVSHAQLYLDLDSAALFMNTPLLQLHLRRRQLAQDGRGHNFWQETATVRTVPADKVAILICDMWDNHWSRGAAERVDAMAPRMNRVVAAARGQGVLIIHAPSDTMNFYAGHPARRRLQAAPVVEPPPPAGHDEPPLPIDAADQGSDTGETQTYRAWRRQHPQLDIDETLDGISDNGQEIYSFLRQHNIEQVLIMGVHTNMCVLNRSFGIKQMVKWGVPIALVRDLTDTMYNPARPPYVSHDEGTALVVEYIEKFWCPSIHSADLLANQAN